MKKIVPMLAAFLVLGLAMAGCSDTAATTTTTTSTTAVTTTSTTADPNTETTTPAATTPEAELVTDAQAAFAAKLETLSQKKANLTDLSYFTYLNKMSDESIVPGIHEAENQGVLGAWYFDLDQDGTDEMIVASFVGWMEEGSQESTNHLVVQVYAYVAGSVTPVSGQEIAISAFEGCHHEDLRLFAQKKGDAATLVIYSRSSAIDPIITSYKVFAYQDGEIKLLADIEGFEGWEASVTVDGTYIYRSEGDEGVGPVDTKHYGDYMATLQGESGLYGVDIVTGAGATVFFTGKVEVDDMDEKAAPTFQLGDSVLS